MNSLTFPCFASFFSGSKARKKGTLKRTAPTIRNANCFMVDPFFMFGVRRPSPLWGFPCHHIGFLPFKATTHAAFQKSPPPVSRGRGDKFGITGEGNRIRPVHGNADLAQLVYRVVVNGDDSL